MKLSNLGILVTSTITRLCAFALIGCSSSDLSEPIQPSPAQPASPANAVQYTPPLPLAPAKPAPSQAAAPAVITNPEPVIETPEEPASIVLPVANSITITDNLGQILSFDSIPKNIATISPSATEMLYAAGGTATVRDRASNFPESVQALPDVGSAYNPSIEALIGAQPDLVIIEALTQARFLPMLKQADLKVMAVKAETIQDITENIQKIGKIIDKETTARLEVSGIASRLSAAKTYNTGSVLLLISDHDRNLYAARPESYTGLIATEVGLINKAAGLPDSGPYPGFAVMGPESILMANPDFIVTITPAPMPAPRLSETIKQIPPFARLKAIQSGNVIEADVNLFLQAPGPRIVEAVEFLKDHIKR